MKPRGFTFIELMITLAIMATLATVAVPMAQVALQRSKEQQLRSALIEVREAIDAYKRASDNGRIKLSLGASGYPKKLDELVEGVPDQRSPSKQNIYFCAACRATRSSPGKKAAPPTAGASAPMPRRPTIPAKERTCSTSPRARPRQA
ncbi:Pullulanase secretion protein pulG [Janthinobacterium lividum]|nr:Pullulanase secretion protein pulG [Janthinobacterium lividum]